MTSGEGTRHFSARFWRAVLGFLLLVGFIIGFWTEIVLIWDLLSAFFTALFLRPVVLPLNAETFKAIGIMSLNTALFISGYLILLAWVSRFVLPALNSKDKKEVSKRLRAYNFPLTQLHGPAVFVKEGEPKGEKSELEEPGQGVALLDLYSAIVLEQQQGNDEDEEQDEAGNLLWNRIKAQYSRIMSAVKEAMRILLGIRNKESDDAMVRAAGPGLAFIQDGEKIIGGADLRKQFRKSDKIKCNTGDGIEVETTVSIFFTLGESPDILNVARLDAGWKIIKMEPVAPLQTDPGITQLTGLRVRVLPEDLREDDQREIENFFERGEFAWTLDKAVESKGNKTDTLPFVFDGARVINALYSRARNVKDGKLGTWTELPLDVAVEIFRNSLVHTSYDELYKPNDPDEYPMKKFRSEFAQAVKNTGVLGYQIVRRKDGHLIEDGQVCKSKDLVFGPSQTFNSPAVLRERGIKVLNVGFSDLVPDDTVREKIFNAWRARWEQESDKIRADHELQATRIRNRERARAQQDMIYSISHILQQSDQYTNEALVMRLYQALEAAATQPATQRLLPRDTIRMLWNLRQWLLPEEHPKDNTVPGDYVEGEETELDE